ncbi:MAG: sulfurtransferase [Pelagibacterales bacterium]|nr:sulfurtransferase [Pelagibacterales bacterium]
MLIEVSALIKLYKNKIWQNNIIILDASWYLPNQNRNAYKEYKNSHIPHALYFDIDKVSNIESGLPHTVPTEAQFTKNMKELGIGNKNHIIIYSYDGIGTSPRAWWLFKLFGHQNVSILNGGLKAWLKISVPESKNILKVTSNIYKAKLNNNLLALHKDITNSFNSINYQIVDARSTGRFKGIDEEPRPGLRKGHIPNSINIPFNIFIDKNGYFITKKEIINILENNKFNFNITTISTCGSGITACVLVFALSFIGKNNWQVYDGSWSEWGLSEKNLIEL